eukprot:1215021-Pyramimonas_sp.AAC.1
MCMILLSKLSEASEQITKLRGTRAARRAIQSWIDMLTGLAHHAEVPVTAYEHGHMPWVKSTRYTR